MSEYKRHMLMPQCDHLLILNLCPSKNDLSDNIEQTCSFLEAFTGSLQCCYNVLIYETNKSDKLNVAE